MLPALGAMFAAASLLVWFEVVAAANAVLATWQPGPLPSQFEQVRNKWEFGHMAVASLKVLSFACLAISCVQKAQDVAKQQLVRRPSSAFRA